MDEKSVDYYVELAYDIALTRKDGRYILFIAELHLVVQDGDLNEAYRQLESEKRGLLENIVRPAISNRSRSRNTRCNGGNSRPA